MARIIGLLVSGFACRAYGVGAALFVAYEAARIIGATLGTVSAAFPG